MWMRVKSWLWNILIAVDQLCNAVLAGSPDETFSARTWRKARAGQWFWRGLRQAIDLVMRWESPAHCRESYEREMDRDQLPREYRR